MNISIKWLKTLTDIHLPTEELCHKLTMSGLEVEGIERVEAVPGGLKGLVIGEVKERWQHPNADRLSLTKVDIGQTDLLQIVCGAPNVAAGQKVVIAPVGSWVHPTQGEPFEIKKAKIRGELSEGMICAEDEIGLGHSHDGILVLDSSAPIGIAASKYFELEADEVISIGLTPNRGDAASHLGVARELKALTGTSWNYPPLANLSEISSFPITVHVENTDACPRYAGILLDQIQVGESPEWLKNRLRSIDLNPINNVVDVTNFVLHELGQPIHAFDADKISGNQIIVRNAKQGETITTLDDKERTLSGTELLICNDQTPMAIAGVFGGKNSGVSNQTSSVFIESAYFNPGSIRSTAKKHGLSTDASFRYERGTDPEIAIVALRRVVYLLQEVAGARQASGLIDVYPEPVQAFTIEFRLSELQRIGGISLSRENIRNILESLEINVLKQSDSDDVWTLEVPAYRSDVSREADIIEELLRIYGLDEIPLSSSMHLTPSLRKNLSLELKRKASNFLSSNACLEIMNNSLSSDTFYPQDDTIQLLNPLSSEMGTLRRSMLEPALLAVAFNKNRKNKHLRFFEFGKIYRKTDSGYEEENQLIILFSGNTHEEHWNQKSRKTSVYDVKGLTEGLFSHLGLQTDESLCAFYKVDGALLKRLDIKDDVFAADIFWDQVVKKSRKRKFKLQEIPVFPEVNRDLSIVVPGTASFSDLKQLAFKNGGQLLKKVDIFDVYTGKPLGDSEKSYSLSFTLYHAQHTLSDKEIESTMQRIQNGFEQAGFTIRK